MRRPTDHPGRSVRRPLICRSTTSPSRGCFLARPTDTRRPAPAAGRAGTPCPRACPPRAGAGGDATRVTPTGCRRLVAGSRPRPRPVLLRFIEPSDSPPPPACPLAAAVPGDRPAAASDTTLPLGLRRVGRTGSGFMATATLPRNPHGACATNRARSRAPHDDEVIGHAAVRHRPPLDRPVRGSAWSRSGGERGVAGTCPIDPGRRCRIRCRFGASLRSTLGFGLTVPRPPSTRRLASLIARLRRGAGHREARARVPGNRCAHPTASGCGSVCTSDPGIRYAHPVASGMSQARECRARVLGHRCRSSHGFGAVACIGSRGFTFRGIAVLIPRLRGRVRHRESWVCVPGDRCAHPTASGSRPASGVAGMRCVKPLPSSVGFGRS